MGNPAWVALSLCKRMGGKTFRNLLTHFDHDLDAILEADEATLRQVRGIGGKIAESIQQIDLNKTVQQLSNWQHQDVEIITWEDATYPPALLNLDDAPPTLFVRGHFPDFSQIRAVAIAGTRRPSPESQKIAERIAIRLAREGYTIVSGLALGIDTMAHQGALAVENGCTLAVLGNGVLSPYPIENRTLAEHITQRGALICEVAPNAMVSTPGLVARNRLISGLAESIIIVETQADGGAMHAARFAQEQGKALYVVDNAASGNRQLLENGASPISSGLNELF